MQINLEMEYHHYILTIFSIGKPREAPGNLLYMGDFPLPGQSTGGSPMMIQLEAPDLRRVRLQRPETKRVLSGRLDACGMVVASTRVVEENAG